MTKKRNKREGPKPAPRATEKKRTPRKGAKKHDHRIAGIDPGVAPGITG